MLGITRAGSSGQTEAISCKPGVGDIRYRFQDGPVRGRQQPAKSDCVIRATDDLHSLDKTPVRMDSVDLPHQLLRRDAVLVRVEAGGGDILGHEPIPSSVQSDKEAHFSPAQGTLTINQDLERPSVHFHSPNSATALSGSAVKICHQPNSSS